MTPPPSTNLVATLGNEAQVVQLSSLLRVEAGLVQEDTRQLPVLNLVNKFLIMTKVDDGGFTRRKTWKGKEQIGLWRYNTQQHIYNSNPRLLKWTDHNNIGKGLSGEKLVKHTMGKVS